MKKYFLFIFFVFFYFPVFAQKYIKLTKDTTIGGNNFLKGEIFLLKTSDSQNKSANFLYGNKVITLAEKAYTTLDSVRAEYSSKKSQFVVRKDSLFYFVAITNIDGKDTIRFIGTGKYQVKFDSFKTKKIEVNKAGETFRLIIPGTPSIIYSQSEFPVLDQQPEETTTSESTGKKSFFQKFKFFILGIVLLLSVGFWFYRNRKYKGNPEKTEPKREKYNGGKLSEFAKKHNIDIKDLLKWNKGIIPSKYENMGENERRQIQKDLKDQLLIVGFQAPIEKQESIFEKEITSETNEQNWENQFSDPAKTSSDSETGKILNAIKRLEQTLINKIDAQTSRQVNASEAEKLKNEIRLSQEHNKQLQDDLIILKDEIRKSQEINLDAEEKVRKYANKVIIVEYLEKFASASEDYFALLKMVADKACDAYKKLIQIGDKESGLISHFLAKYQYSLPAKWGNWDEICREIRVSKTISNPEIISSFTQLTNNEEKIRTFRNLLHKEVLEKYAGASLILSQELKNISKFTGETVGIFKDIELSFEALVDEIVNKGRTVDLEINYAPLFENYAPYANKVRAVNEKHSLVYSSLQISKDSISEIISYGFGSEPTKIILS
jgi:hypothetical protein